MPEFVVMFPADSEAERDAREPAERRAVFDVDFEFGQRLEARGGAVTGGAGLTPSSRARTLRRGSDLAAEVSEGPYLDSDGQLSGFFIVRCDDLDALLAAAEVLVEAHPVVEIRPVQEY